MSSSAATPLPPPPPPPSITISSFVFTSIGIGNLVFIGFSVLSLLSVFLVYSYYVFCLRPRRRRRLRRTSAEISIERSGIIFPRIIFFTADDDGGDGDLEANGESVVLGLNQSVINSYPKFQFSKESEVGGCATCSICLCEYQEAEMLRMMPECKHSFHMCCLDVWLKIKRSCPICRNSPLPIPQPKPLPEFVSVSQHAAGRISDDDA